MIRIPDDESNYQHISALNDLLFCERRAALHLIEQIWRDNQYTVEGSYAHRNVDVEANLKRGDKRNVTGMWLVSHRLEMIGRADLVEFRAESLPDSEQLRATAMNKTSTTASRKDAATLTPYPVDFKRGKKRRWDNNEVQL